MGHLLVLPEFCGIVRQADIDHVVETSLRNGEPRFELFSDPETGERWIRATRGHTMSFTTAQEEETQSAWTASPEGVRERDDAYGYQTNWATDVRPTAGGDPSGLDSAADPGSMGEGKSPAGGGVTSRTWKKFQNPNDNSYWWWCEENEDFFFEHCPGPWTRYKDFRSCRQGWRNSETGE